MKKLIIIAALLTAFTAAQAQTPATAATEVKLKKLLRQKLHLLTTLLQRKKMTLQHS